MDDFLPAPLGPTMATVAVRGKMAERFAPVPGPARVRVLVARCLTVRRFDLDYLVAGVAPAAKGTRMWKDAS